MLGATLRLARMVTIAAIHTIVVLLRADEVGHGLGIL